jgi:hypothetical protein
LRKRQEALRTPKKQDQKRASPRHIIVKKLNVQDKLQEKSTKSPIKANPSK